MIQETEMLNYILQNVEMGLYGIQNVLPKVNHAKLFNALKAERTEYSKIYRSAAEMLKKRQESPAHISPMARVSSQLSATFQLIRDSSVPHIAEMLIQGNTMGVTKLIRHMNEYTGSDERVLDLAHKLRETEESNIHQLKQLL